MTWPANLVGAALTMLAYERTEGAGLWYAEHSAGAWHLTEAAQYSLGLRR